MRRNPKRWAVLFTVAALCTGMAAPMHALAAEEEVSVSDDTDVLTTENVLNEVSPVTVSTTQRCSVWSAPATTDENRVKYVDEGYQITIYPEVVASTLGDGKTFYRTIRGAYILCRCVDVADGSVAESGNGTVVIPSAADVLAALLADKEARVADTTARSDHNGGSWSISECVGGTYIDNRDGRTYFTSYLIRSTTYRADGTISRIDIHRVPEQLTLDFDEAGRAQPFYTCQWDIVYYEDGKSIHVMHEYDPDMLEYASENCTKMVVYNRDGSLDRMDVYIRDASGKCIKTMVYDSDGRCYSQDNIYDASGELIKVVFYNPDGSVACVRTWDASGKEHNKYY